MNRAARETDAAEEPTDEANDDEKSVQGEASQDQPAARMKAPPFPTSCAHTPYYVRLWGKILFLLSYFPAMPSFICSAIASLTRPV
jgi:hypothetical protein